MIGNVVWLLLAGWWLALGHLVTAILVAVTIVGIPFAWAHLKLAGTGAVADREGDHAGAERAALVVFISTDGFSLPKLIEIFFTAPQPIFRTSATVPLMCVVFGRCLRESAKAATT